MLASLDKKLVIERDGWETTGHGYIYLLLQRVLYKVVWFLSFLSGETVEIVFEHSTDLPLFLFFFIFDMPSTFCGRFLLSDAGDGTQNCNVVKLMACETSVACMNHASSGYRWKRWATGGREWWRENIKKLQWGKMQWNGKLASTRLPDSPDLTSEQSTKLVWYVHLFQSLHGNLSEKEKWCC